MDRWAENGQIRVTIVDEGKSYPTSPEKAARERDYYSLQHPDLDEDEIPRLLVETMLGKLERRAKEIIDALLACAPGPASLSDQDLFEMSTFLAFQITRGHAFREEQRHHLTEYMRLRFGDLTDDQIRRQLTKSGTAVSPEVLAQHRQGLADLASGKITIRYPRPKEVLALAEAATSVAEHLFVRQWHTYATPPLLVTCDEPVVALGGPGHPREERSGLGTAGGVLFPLGPTRLLVLFHPNMTPHPPWTLNAAETVEVNHEILAAAARWAFERPSRRVTTRMQVPPLPPEPVRRDGPFPHPRGEPGELYRFAKPTRWSQQRPMPQWPVERWWK